MGKQLWWLVFTAMLLMVFASGTTQAVQTEDALATLEPLAGEVQWLPMEGGEWIIITQPILVAEGDQIQTGAEGWALLTFFEGVSSEILANTHVLVTALDLPVNDGDSFAISFDLLVGDTFNSVNVILDQGSTFEIRTPTVTASVRGTQYYILTSPTGQSMIVTEEGDVSTQQDWVADDKPESVSGGQTMVSDGVERQVYNSLLLPDFSARTSNVSEIELAGCGDGYCAYEAGEGLLTCRADCGSVVEFPNRAPMRAVAELPDRFDFDALANCLSNGTCARFCRNNRHVPACDRLQSLGLVDCAAEPLRCRNIRADRDRVLFTADGGFRQLPDAVRPEVSGDRDRNLPSIDNFRPRSSGGRQNLGGNDATPDSGNGSFLDGMQGN